MYLPRCPWKQNAAFCEGTNIGMDFRKVCPPLSVLGRRMLLYMKAPTPKSSWTSARCVFPSLSLEEGCCFLRRHQHRHEFSVGSAPLTAEECCLLRRHAHRCGFQQFRQRRLRPSFPLFPPAVSPPWRVILGDKKVFLMCEVTVGHWRHRQPSAPRAFLTLLLRYYSPA